MTHGKAWAYRHGCRCPACTEAHRADHKARRARFAARPQEDKPHGTMSAYTNWGCRCGECKAAYRQKNALYKARRKRRRKLPLSPLESAALAAAGGV